ncbi:MAG: saccharopine dehydrogenase NADP-binding domain-containing protein [Fimbriimonadaceae bacterium]|nr:saccharopine dehydrogenase NADP-binding domain-containing protein [Fimbriimonadaceae bacterium]
MSARFAVVGCGIQGTAAAYDLLQFTDGPVTLADAEPKRAERTRDRLVQLLPESEPRLRSEPLDVKDTAAVEAFLAHHDVLVSAVPYRLHPALEHPAIVLGKSVVDMGNDTDAVLVMLDRDAEARVTGATIVPDAGLAPGLVNSFALALLERHPEARAIRAYCGGLPKRPRPPLNYALRFSLESLLGEYEDDAFELREGDVVRIDPLTDLEQIDFPGVGTLEAFVTSGGSGTAPFTFRGRLDSYSYKTLRYPGHCQAMRTLRDLGFWDSAEVSPGMSSRAATIRVLERVLTDEDGEDAVFVKVAATLADGSEHALFLNEGRDPSTGFTAMERLTGFSTAILAQAVAEGEVRPGVVPYESAISGESFLRRLARRGIAPFTAP